MLPKLLPQTEVCKAAEQTVPSPAAEGREYSETIIAKESPDLSFWPAFEPRSMNCSVLRSICTWLRNEDFQLGGSAPVIVCKRERRGIGAEGVREGSAGNPGLQLMLKEKR